MCGEKVLWLFVIELIKGSPPRVRGKGDIKAAEGVLRRITPACAGKSKVTKFLHNVLQDHPRVCGEKFWITT